MPAQALVAVDVGGTFTDVVSVLNGAVTIAKVPTDVNETYRSVLAGGDVVGVENAAVFNHASTHGVNAIITRRLPKIGFLTTDGFRDVLDMGTVWRPFDHATDPGWRRSFGDVTAPIVPRYLRRGVIERIAANGEVIVAFDEAQAREQIRLLGRCGVQGVAICLLSSYVNPTHERRLAELVREELGEVAVSVSHEISPMAKEYPRASTTVVDTVMKLIYREYTDSLDRGLRERGFSGQLNYADSAGMLMSADFAMEQPYRVVFSGPAGGTVASAGLGEIIGDGNLLCADVGGTSLDLSVVSDGAPYRNLSFEFEFDLIVNSVATAISTIGAGGGSVAWVNELGELHVGPDSAGADPGPACYGLGGTRPTTTDACLLMGFLDPAGLLGGSMPLDASLSEQAFLGLDLGVEYTLSDRVHGAWEMALNNVVQGIFNVAMSHGVDPRDYSLMAFGAAGPMMLPSVLEMSHVRRVIVPPRPGNFSALGLLSSDPVYADSRTKYLPCIPESADAVDSLIADMTSELIDRLPSTDGVVIERAFDGRLYGQSHETPFVPLPGGRITGERMQEIAALFHDEYEKRNGIRFVEIPVEMVTFRIQATIPAPKVEYKALPTRAPGEDLVPVGSTTFRHLPGGAQDAPCYRRDDLRAGDQLVGPAIVREQMSTTVLPKNHVLEVGAFGELLITLSDTLRAGARR